MSILRASPWHWSQRGHRSERARIGLSDPPAAAQARLQWSEGCRTNSGALNPAAFYQPGSRIFAWSCRRWTKLAARCGFWCCALHQAVAKTSLSVLGTAVTFRRRWLPLSRRPVIAQLVPPAGLHPQADRLVAKAQVAPACEPRVFGHDAWFRSAACPAVSGVLDDLLHPRFLVHMRPMQKAAIGREAYASFMQTAEDAYRIVIAEQAGFRGSDRRRSHGSAGQAVRVHRGRAWRPGRIIERAGPAFQTLSLSGAVLCSKA